MWGVLLYFPTTSLAYINQPKLLAGSTYHSVILPVFVLICKLEGESVITRGACGGRAMFGIFAVVTVYLIVFRVYNLFTKLCPPPFSVQNICKGIKSWMNRRGRGHR